MASQLQCAIPTRHTPAPLTIEAHHIICVAWQQFWQPATPPFPGRDPDGRGMLWDNRTVVLCPTHHRNVHALIVQAMHQVHVLGRNVLPVLVISRAHRPEAKLALAGLHRLLDVGGSLVALAAAGEWGEA